MDSTDLQLQDLPIEEALERWLSELDFLKAVARMDPEQIPVTAALHRVTSAPVIAQMSSPHYYAAAVDGLALRAADTFAARESGSVDIELGECGVFVEMGSPLPDGCDAVIPLREIGWAGGNAVRLSRASNPWRNVRPTGEDVADREVVLARDHRVGPLDVGAMTAAGIEKVRVYRRPKVHILALGSHLVAGGVRPEVGQMVDTNGPALAGLVAQAGGEPFQVDVVPERLEEAGAALLKAAQDSDLVCVVAGPSHGTAMLARLFSDLGDRVLHGLAASPCHGLALGVVDSTPVLGFPFHPVSVYLLFEMFARPVLAELLGPSALPHTHTAEGTLAVELRSTQGVEEFVRVKMGVVDERVIAVPERSGSTTLMSLVRSTGFARIPGEVEVLSQGSPLCVRLLAPERSLRGNILLLGTHDICYDLIRSLVLSSFPELLLHTSATGGAAGLEALSQGLCHVAAIHLFDEETGEYNVPFMKRQMSGRSVLVNLFSRDLGLIVGSGNPLQLAGLQDLVGRGVRFINRQPGSGTRALIDYHVKQAGLDESRIEGYPTTVRTHMAVAAAVSSGAVDVGPGISTAARSLGLDFVPCIPERLDLAIPRPLMNRFPVAGLLEVIRTARFRREAARSLPDYDFSQTGQVLWES